MHLLNALPPGLLRGLFRRVLVLAPCTGSLPAASATIDWAEPQNIAGASDVSTRGRLVVAVNGTAQGHAEGVTRVNGVDFQNLDVAGANALPHLSLTFNPGRNNAKVFGSGNLEGEITKLVRGGIYGGTGPNPAPYKAAFSGLVVGASYEIQLFVNDARRNRDEDWATCLSNGRDDGADAAVVSLSNAGQGVPTGDFIVGTFVADADTQAFLFNGFRDGGVTVGAVGRAHINAIQLRLIGDAEPAEPE